MSEKIDWRIICFGILCLTGLEIAALCKGIDGVLFTVVIAVIAGAIGVAIPNPIKTK